MEIKEIRSAGGLDEIKEEWYELYERCSWATPFQSPDWLLPWCQSFGSGELLVLTAWQGREIVGIAPLYIDPGHESGPEVRFLGTGISDYLDFLCEPDCAELITAGFLEHVWDIRDRWKRCRLQEIRRESPLFSVDPGTFPPLSIVPTGVCPVVQLPPTEESYVKSLSSNLRRSLKQTGKKLAPVIIERTPPREVPDVMELLFLLHRKRWEGRGMPGVLYSPEIQMFHHTAASLFAARGSLGLYTLRSQGNVCAVLYGFGKAPRFYAYLSGFDPALEDLSPGALLISYVILEKLRAGYSHFDLLRGSEKYKYLWGGQDTVNYRIDLGSEPCGMQ